MGKNENVTEVKETNAAIPEVAATLESKEVPVSQAETLPAATEPKEAWYRRLGHWAKETALPKAKEIGSTAIKIGAGVLAGIAIVKVGEAIKNNSSSSGDDAYDPDDYIPEDDIGEATYEEVPNDNVE